MPSIEKNTTLFAAVARADVRKLSAKLGEPGLELSENDGRGCRGSIHVRRNGDDAFAIRPTNTREASGDLGLGNGQKGDFNSVIGPDPHLVEGA